MNPSWTLLTVYMGFQCNESKFSNFYSEGAKWIKRCLTMTLKYCSIVTLWMTRKRKKKTTNWNMSSLSFLPKFSCFLLPKGIFFPPPPPHLSFASLYLYICHINLSLLNVSNPVCSRNYITITCNKIYYILYTNDESLKRRWRTT